MATISIVTPCLNQGEYLEATLTSILRGSRPPDELVVVDGGSTDGSIDVIHRFEKELTRWVSEPDGGQYEAIQKGFERTTGEVMAWLNGGDLYFPWTLDVVAELFNTFPQLEWLTTQRPLTVDDRGRVVSCEFVGAYAPGSFRAGVNLPGGSWFARAGIQQESTFWRRSLWERAGACMATELQLAGDFELWLRFFEHAELHALDSPLGARRVHAGQKTAVLDRYVEEAERLLRSDGHRPGGGLAGTARRATYHGLGRRPLRRVPRLLAAPLQRARLLHAAPTIVWRDGIWHVVQDYAV